MNSGFITSVLQWSWPTWPLGHLNPPTSQIWLSECFVAWRWRRWGHGRPGFAATNRARLTWISQTSLVPGPTSLPIRIRNPNISQSGDSKAQRGQLQKRLLGQRRVLPSRRLHIHLKLWAVDHWGTESVKHCSCGWVRIDITCFKMNRYASTSDCLISHQPLTSFKKGSVQCQGHSVSFCRVWK